jgi:hexulose-6-phosphate isomerase
MQDTFAHIVLSSACFPPDASIETIVAHAPGYAGLELVMRERAGALRFKTSASELARLREAASGLTLGIVNVHLELPVGVHAAHVDARSGAAELITAALRKVSVLGARSMSVVPAVIGPWPDGDYCEAMQVVHAALRELGREAERAGVAIGVVPASGGFLLSPFETRQFIDEVNSPHVGVVLEVEAVRRVGFIEQWVKALGRRIIAVRTQSREQLEGVSFAGTIIQIENRAEAS